MFQKCWLGIDSHHSPSPEHVQAWLKLNMFLYFISSLLKYKFQNVTNISTEKLNDLISEGQIKDKKLVIVDARSEDEFNVSSLDHAIHINFPLEQGSVKRFVDQNVTENTENIVCYCSLGYRSSIVAQHIQSYLEEADNSRVNVYNLEGSIFKWLNEERTVTNKQGDIVSYAHPFSFKWGILGLSISKWRWLP